MKNVEGIGLQHSCDFKASCVFNENKSKILAPDKGATLSSLKYP